MHCNILHVKIGKPPRAAKLHMGVSIDINNPSQAYCNKCNNQAVLTTLSGHVTRATVGKKVEVMSICSICGTFSNHLKVHGTLICCATCAGLQSQKYLDTALPCPCNVAHSTPSKHVFIAKRNQKYVLIRACTKHAHLVNHSIVTDVSAWQTVFDACGSV